MIATAPIILRASPTEFLEMSGVERFSDGSGYRCSLSIGSSRFACAGHPFYFDDLTGFAESLGKAYDRVAGKARLGQLYEKDFVQIEVLRRGHVSVSGFVVEYGPPHQELRFAFECDQTFLPELLRSLGQVSAELEPKT